jgi:4-oxalocrotonate tautomerase
MPYINIKITDESVTLEQKSALIKGVTELMEQVLKKDPATTFVVIDEINLNNWGIGGLTVTDYRKQQHETS